MAARIERVKRVIEEAFARGLDMRSCAESVAYVPMEDVVHIRTRVQFFNVASVSGMEIAQLGGRLPEHARRLGEESRGKLRELIAACIRVDP